MVCLYLANGFEETEAVTTYDILKRAGLAVTIVGVGGKTIRGAHGLTVEADVPENAPGLSDPDMIVLPGGMPGARNLKNSDAVSRAIRNALAGDKIIGAICAAPGVVLAGTGALKGKRWTCYPGFEVPEGRYTGARAERDGNLITANGPGAAPEFAFLLAEAALGGQAAAALQASF
ncbi:MAG TPA: DJ-1/PfpI family protein [Oscillospiraceae bacterium]|nr:DJ-1/PfpI family protein [Oscillospiraceae bacterium]HNW03984.1 DJ-1/PfpI family protein [Oscillospiraceae bacterium]HPV99823.1 DJ-1/PfpI family protein [Oscillospiraceae bacterium]